MSLEMKGLNKGELPADNPPIVTKGKYSLKDHSFRKGMAASNTSHGIQKQRSQLNQFVSFISEHNQLLATKNNLIKNIKLQGKEDSFNCFGGCTSSTSPQTFISRMKNPDHQATSTLSSSSLSEIATQRAHATNKSNSNQHFKINTRSILQNLIKEGYCMSTTKDSAFGNINSNLGSMYDQRSCTRLINSNSHFKASQNKKVSLKTKKNKLSQQQEEPLQRKESLSYQRLCNPFRLSGELWVTDSFAQQNIQNTQSTEENSPLLKFQKRRRYSEQPSRNLIERWLKLPQIKNPRSKLGELIDEKTLAQINMDIPRTPNCKSIQAERYHNQLKEILLTYCLLNPQIGYVQGMNLIAAGILYHSYDSKSGSLIFNYLMMDNNFQAIYQGDFTLISRLSKQLQKQIQKYSERLSHHINQCGVDLEILARSWYLSMLGSFVPLSAMDLVIDKFLRKHFRGINQILLTLLLYLKQQLLNCDSADLVFKLSTNQLMKRARSIDWDQLVACSQNLFIENLWI